MRRALPLVLLPLTLLLAGCFCDEDVPYHEVRVNNRTNGPVTIRYTAVTFVEPHTDEDGDTTYTYMTAKRTRDLAPGAGEDLRVPREAEISIKAEYQHLIHWFEQDADPWRSCDATIDMHWEDFVPAAPSANG